MKFLLLLPVALLVACASTEPYNNEQVRTQCAIGYHEEYSYAFVKSKDKNEGETSKLSEDFRCVTNSNEDKFIQHHDQN